MAGAEAVALCGGPEIPVRLGRLDSRCNILVCSFVQFIYIINQTLRDSILLSVFPHSSEITHLSCSTADPVGKLPEETLDVVALKTSFSKKGFS